MDEKPINALVEVMKTPTDWIAIIGVIATVISVVVGGILSFLLYKVSKNQYRLLAFQQLESGDKQKIQKFQKDVHTEFYRFGYYIGEIRNSITKLCLLPNQPEVNSLILQIINNDLNFFSRTNEKGIINFTSYVKMFECSIFNENKTVYSYLKKLDNELFNLRINETSFQQTGWKNCSNVLSSPNSKKDDFSDIEREYTKLKQLTAKYKVNDE